MSTMSIELFKSNLKKFEQELTHQSLTEIYLQYQEWPLSKEEEAGPEVEAFNSGLKVKLTPISCSDYWQLLKKYDQKFIRIGYCWLFKLVNILLEHHLLIEDDFHQQFIKELDSVIVRVKTCEQSIICKEDYLNIYRQIYFSEYIAEIKLIIENNGKISNDDLDRWFVATDYFGCLDVNKMYGNGKGLNSTLFHYLAWSGQLESLKYLVSLEPLTGMSDIHWGYDIPFGIVCERNHLAVARYMISLESTHGEINIFDNCGQNFICAARKGQLEILKYLMELASQRIIDFRRNLTLQEIINAAESADQPLVLKYLHTEVPKKIAEIDQTIKVPEYVVSRDFVHDFVSKKKDIYVWNGKYIKSTAYLGELELLKEIMSHEDFLTQIELNNLTLQEIFQAAAEGDQYETVVYLHQQFPEVVYFELDNVRRETEMKILELFCP